MEGHRNAGVKKALGGFVCFGAAAGGINTVTLAVTQASLRSISWDCYSNYFGSSPLYMCRGSFAMFVRPSQKEAGDFPAGDSERI